MRAFRLALFFAVGLILGGGSVAAFAAASDYGRSMRLNAPPSSGAKFTGAPIYDWADAPSGWGRMNDINKINIGGKSFDVTGGRLFSPGTLAKGAVSFVRYGGIGWAGLMLAPLIWDAAQGWLIDPPAEDEELVPKDYSPGAYTIMSWPGTFNTPRDACLSMKPAQPVTGGYYWTAPDAFACLREAGYGALHWGRGPSMVCPEGSQDLGNGSCRVPGVDEPPRPVSDAELEDAIYAELVARGMGSELARRLIEAGYQPEVDQTVIDGPSSVPGSTTTTTSTGPDGTTTSTTTTTHNVTYNTTNNISTVTITTTTTTTAPDGTTTTTETPAEGEPEEEPEYRLEYAKPPKNEVPDFYEQRYPDGFAGEWDDFKGRVSASSLAGFMQAVASGIPAGGTCPSWSFNLNFGAMGNFGTHQLQPPCIIWPFIKTLMILSALFVARRMVIGG